MTLVLLLWTATVTPFEVGFLTTSVNGLFWINRVIDLCFLKVVTKPSLQPSPLMPSNADHIEKNGHKHIET